MRSESSLLSTVSKFFADSVQRSLALLCTLIVASSPLLYSQPKATIVGGLSFDFGNLYSSLKVKRLVTIRNDGTDTLWISDLSTSCGCTGTLLSRPNLAPRDSATLEISFDPRNFNGQVEKAVSMKTNDKKSPNPHIVFKANIVKLVQVDPEYIIFRTTVGQPATESFALTNVQATPIHIVSSSSTSAQVSFGKYEKELPPWLLSRKRPMRSRGF